VLAVGSRALFEISSEHYTEGDASRQCRGPGARRGFK